MSASKDEERAIQLAGEAVVLANSDRAEVYDALCDSLHSR